MDINGIQPLTEERLKAMDYSEIRQAEAIITQQVIQIAVKHLKQHSAEAGLESREDETPIYESLLDKSPTSWSMLGMYLHSDLIPHVRVLEDAEYLAFLRAMFAEIFDFLMFAYDGAPSYQVAELIRAFGSGLNKGPTLLRLLPDRANSIIVEADQILDEQHEEYLRRLDQMGY